MPPTQTTGRITVDVDGSVVDVSLDGAERLGAEVIAGYENVVRGWRFEPVTEDGRPVRAVAHMQLSLVAARDLARDRASFGIRHVIFLDPPTSAGGEPGRRSAGLRPPNYPEEALRAEAGAEVMLLVQTDAEGKVLAVHADTVTLLRADLGNRAERMANRFARAAERAAKRWQLPGYADGFVRVPVRFIVGSGDLWERMYPVAYEPDPWVLATRARYQPELLSADGAAPSKLRLQSELEGVPGLDGGG
ncbi:hypothetical protein [Arenimonas composti]|uniref:TonB C-terminal domain-containing protein n=1 Tax=Arenimonas composti TR7-09 = DSM 18010 TaxID=1121013 RepID=A0A091BBN7_9GAMM|nr:hypothetical protein [Arenimonas composti]KFN50058.1 hypothetical protein P873_08440 [Arenimonas composti TR7-09 = DSM 18010]